MIKKNRKRGLFLCYVKTVYLFVKHNEHLLHLESL